MRADRGGTAARMAGSGVGGWFWVRLPVRRRAWGCVEAPGCPTGPHRASDGRGGRPGSERESSRDARLGARAGGGRGSRAGPGDDARAARERRAAAGPGAEELSSPCLDRPEDDPAADPAAAGGGGGGGGGGGQGCRSFSSQCRQPAGRPPSSCSQCGCGDDGRFSGRTDTCRGPPPGFGISARGGRRPGAGDEWAGLAVVASHIPITQVTAIMPPIMQVTAIIPPIMQVTAIMCGPPPRVQDNSTGGRARDVPSAGGVRQKMATAFDSLAHLVGGAAHDLDDAREAAAAQRAAAARGALPPQAAGAGGAQAAVAAFDKDGIRRVLHAGEALRSVLVVVAIDCICVASIAKLAGTSRSGQVGHARRLNYRIRSFTFNYGSCGFVARGKINIDISFI